MDKVIEMKHIRFKKVLATLSESSIKKGYLSDSEKEMFLRNLSDLSGFHVTEEHLRLLAKKLPQVKT